MSNFLECSTSRNDIIEIPIDSSGENKVDQPDRKNSKGEIDKPNGLASLKLMYDSNESENEDDTSPKGFFILFSISISSLDFYCHVEWGILSLPHCLAFNIIRDSQKLLFKLAFFKLSFRESCFLNIP